jgi:hypothetical protein
MNDKSNPFVNQIDIFSSLMEQSSQSVETIKNHVIQILNFSSLTYSNFTLMSNRLIDFQLSFETKFTELTVQLTSNKLETMLSNLFKNIVNSQSEFFNSLPNSIGVFLSPLKALNEMEPANHNLKTSLENIGSILQDLVEKKQHDLLISYE